jgi:hypothetical protein
MRQGTALDESDDASMAAAICRVRGSTSTEGPGDEDALRRSGASRDA